MTPRPTDSTGEFENLSDEIEELCYSSFFPDLCNTYLEFFSLPDLTNLCILLAPAQVSAEQKDLGDSAMGDGEKTCPCCQFYGVPCRQVRAIEMKP